MERLPNNARRKLGFFLGAIAAFMLCVSSALVLAEGDLPSTPRHTPSKAKGILIEAAEAAAAAQTQAPMELSGPAVQSLVQTGLNFRTSLSGVDSGFIPPDTMGAVGPNHIVEMINGNFQVFNKQTGASLDSRSLDSFWTNLAGVTIPVFNDTCPAGGGTCSQSGNTCTTNAQCESNFTFDPRIVYDPASGRWFATSLDSTNPATDDNNIYVAVSNTDDPRPAPAGGGWQGFLFDADTAGSPQFHDYDTLAVDADGLYICTQDFDTGSGGGGVESCYSIPKASLLQNPPSNANMTRFEASPAGLPGVAGSLQPALDFGVSVGRTPLLGVSGGGLVRSSILGSGAAGATLSAVVGIAGAPPHANPPAARQPTPGPTIENVAPRFVANVVKQGDSLWAVHAVQGTGSNSALRWYEIDEASNTVLQSGLIENVNQDFHEPSIAVNEFGHAVIGYTCSGPSLPASACASVGETVGGVMAFEAPLILAAANLTAPNQCYFQEFNDRNRWGDYSATVLDPVTPCTFWTFQEFLAVGADCNTVGTKDANGRWIEGGQWGTQVTQLAISPPVITVPGDVSLPDTCLGQSGTAKLEVCNTTPNSGPCANLVVSAITSSNGQFEVATPSSDYPVVISPDFCFPFQVRFTPTSIGAKSATLTIPSNDPDQPSLTIQVTGNGVQQHISAWIANSGDFGDVCLGAYKDLNLTINNTGGCDLSISGITSSSVEFKVPTDVTYPIVIAPGGLTIVPIRFMPANAGAKTASITITSNDPASPKVVTVSGNAPQGDVRVTGATDFGNICAGVLAEKKVSLCNVGKCNLNVLSAAFNPACADFTLVNNPFPAPVSPDSCLDLVIRFTPTSAGPKSCTLVIMTDDPDTPIISRTVTANTPFPAIDVPPDQAFAPEVVQSLGACTTSKPFPISNTGQCNLTITNIALNGADYALSGLPSFPIILEPGHIAGEGSLQTVFAPLLRDRDLTGTLTVIYESDPITHTSTSVTRRLCGEGVNTGARVLVQAGGAPLALVEKIQLQRINANRNKKILDTNP
jgi:hypothetical protein